MFDPAKVTQLHYASREVRKGQIPIPVTYIGEGTYKYSYAMKDGTEDQTVISIVKIDPGNADIITCRNAGKVKQGVRSEAGFSKDGYAKSLDQKTLGPFNRFLMDEVQMLTNLKDNYQLPVVEMRNSLLVSPPSKDYANYRPLFFRCLENPDLVVAGYLTKYYGEKDGWGAFKADSNEGHPSWRNVMITGFKGFRNRKTEEEVIAAPFAYRVGWRQNSRRRTSC